MIDTMPIPELCAHAAEAGQATVDPDEVAAVLACSAAAARKRVQRGLERLRAFLAQRGVGRPTAALAMVVAEIAMLSVPAQAGELAIVCAASGPAAQAPGSLATLAHRLAKHWTGLAPSTTLAVAIGLVAVLLTLATAAASSWWPRPRLAAVEAGQPEREPDRVDATLTATLATPVHLRLRRATLDEAIAALRLQVRVRVAAAVIRGPRPYCEP